MERGYITITENDKHEYTVEARLIKGTLWLSKWQIATLFNVYTKNIESNLKAIFKAGLLNENQVSKIHSYENNGVVSEDILYNIDALIFVGFRIASFEANAFREWVLKGFSEFMKNEKMKTHNVMIVLNSKFNLPIITSLN